MYYDMSGFDYGILDVVQVLHLRKRRGNYYDCPFCGETHGKLNINVEKFLTVFMNDQKIELSLKEFTVLKYLTEHPGWVFSHEEIYRNVWKEEPIDCANAVMCCISQLRKKLKVDSRNWNYIRTVRGVGYKFQPLSGE